jgi:hypothetical protein
VFAPIRRATIRMPSGPKHDPGRDHLFVLVTDPITVDGVKKILVVPLSSIKPYCGHDATCCLVIGDHPYINKPSFIDYSMAKVLSATSIQSQVDLGFFEAREMVSPQVMAKICAGILASPSTPPSARDFYQKTLIPG